MKYPLLILVTSASLLGVSACQDFTTPAGVIGSAAQSLVANDLKSFRRTLDGDARRQYGNADGLATLREHLQGQAPRLGAIDLVHSDFDRWKRHGFRTYRADATVEGRPVLGLDVSCEVDLEFDSCPYLEIGTDRCPVIERAWCLIVGISRL